MFNEEGFIVYEYEISEAKVLKKEDEKNVE
jgi:hypothetical protein